VRISDKMGFDQVNTNVGKNRTEMAELQNQAATQKRVTKPSDDPLAATRILQTRTEIGAGKQFIKSVAIAKNFLEYSDQSLGELTDILVRAKELAINQSSDASASEQTRNVAGTEIRQLFNQAVQVGNRKQGDRFLFGGFKTTKPPFDPNGNYHGDSGEMKIVVNKEAKVAMNMPGDKIFLGRSTQAPHTSGPLDPIREEIDSATAKEEDSLARGPASIAVRTLGPLVRQTIDNTLRANELPAGPVPELDKKGVSVFKVLNDLEIGLKSNDKQSVQDTLERIDDAISQVVTSRAELGSRASTLQNATDSLTKGQIDAKTLASNLEDVDTFELVSDINKTESTLKATLATSGKLIQPSLLDFIK
jgi:flagellar hook-associated protein 3 FlgL